MFVRRGPAIMLSLVLGAAALVSAPSALARDGEIVKDIDSCQGAGTSTYKLKVTTVTVNDRLRLEVTGIVWSDDEDLWDWKFKHGDDVSDDGVVRAMDANKSFKIVRTMVDFAGPDTVVFRAENSNTHEVCRGEVIY